MFDYLQQFNKLPRELRDRVSSPAAMEILSSLEGKYGVSLAMLVMQVMIKQILIKDLVPYLITELGLNQDKAQALATELKERLFFSVATYLGLKIEALLSPEEKELQVLMKENNVILPSQDLMSRCQQILLTYRKGVRTKMDTRSALERPVTQGGLNLDSLAADRLLKALDRPLNIPSVNPLPTASSALRDLVDKTEAATAYDFKSALAGGQIKAPIELADKFKAPLKLDLQHELEPPDMELALEAPLAPELLTATVPKAPVQTQAQAQAQTQNQTQIGDAPELSADLPVTPVIPVSPLTLVSPLAAATEIDPLAELRPVAPSNIAFKKAPSAASDLWSKLFKSKAADLKSNVVSSNHLEEAVKEAVQQSIISPRPAAFSEARLRMDDVKAKPKVMGPLDELRYLDLVNFRRLGLNPKEITNKIVMKIKLLEKDGYDRMVEGVKSWRQSPVNRIYVRLAQEAVSQGITLRDAVAARQADKKETLSMEEIEAIVAMNSRLMF